ncbi:MAG: EamA family transporter [Alphaproteobacteria bacterium]
MAEYLWLIYAVLAAVAAALVSIFGKMGLQGIDTNTATVIRSVIMSLFLIMVMVMQKNYNHIAGIVTNKKAILFIALSGIAGALSWLFYFAALKYGKVSQVAPVDKLSVVLAAILAVVFLNEHLSLLAVGGIVLITAGVLCVTFG